MSEGPLFLGVKEINKFLFYLKVPLSFCFFGGWGEPDVTWVRFGLGVCG
jgi:hypothetical protein